MGASRRRRPTATSPFEVGRWESHDSSYFYSRFNPPRLDKDEAVNPPSVVDRIFVGDARDRAPLRRLRRRGTVRGSCAEPDRRRARPPWRLWPSAPPLPRSPARRPSRGPRDQQPRGRKLSVPGGEGGKAGEGHRAGGAGGRQVPRHRREPADGQRGGGELRGEDCDSEDWHFDVSGAFTSTQACLRRTDTLWKALGEAGILASGQLSRRPLVFRTTDLPPKGGDGDAALRAGLGKIYFDAIEMLSPAGQERLVSYAAGGATSIPRASSSSPTTPMSK
jgi:hypothetical protein